MKKFVIESGLKLGGGLVIYTLLLYIGGIEYLASFRYSALTFIIMIGALIWFGLSYRKQNGGFISFKESFIALSLTFIIAMALSTVFNILLYQVIDPGLGEAMNREIINKTVKMLEGFNMPEEEIDKMVSEIEKQGNKFTIPGMLRVFLYMSLFGAVLAAIISLCVKKSPTPFETIDN